MYIIILLASFSMFTPCAYGMQGAMQAPLPVAPVPAHNLLQHFGQQLPMAGSCTQTCRPSLINPEHSVAKAIESGNATEVARYFAQQSSWRSYISPWQTSGYEVAETLKYAVTFPSQKTQKVVALLLSKINATYLEEPECVRKDALANGHLRVVSYINKHFPDLPRLHQSVLDRLAMDDEKVIKKHHEATSEEMGCIILGVVFCPVTLLGLLLCCNKEEEKEKEE